MVLGLPRCPDRLCRILDVISLCSVLTCSAHISMTWCPAYSIHCSLCHAASCFWFQWVSSDLPPSSVSFSYPFCMVDAPLVSIACWYPYRTAEHALANPICSGRAGESLHDVNNAVTMSTSERKDSSAPPAKAKGKTAMARYVDGLFNAHCRL